jgi:hypothetical protein
MGTTARRLTELTEDSLTIQLATESLFDAHPTLRQADDYLMLDNGMDSFDVGKHEQDGITDFYFTLLDKWAIFRYWLEVRCPDTTVWANQFKEDKAVLKQAVGVWEAEGDYTWPLRIDQYFEGPTMIKASESFVQTYMRYARLSWHDHERTLGHRIVATVQVVMGSEHACDVCDAWTRVKAELDNDQFLNSKITSIEVI